MPKWPVHVDGKLPKLKPSPRLGEHNADVLNDFGWVPARHRSRR